jgi:phosphoglycolate phosphatase
VVAFLAAHELERLVGGSARDSTQSPSSLKPNPFLVRRAIVERDAAVEECVMIGDSLSDLEAARAARIAAVAFANKPGKEAVFAGAALPPAAIVPTMFDFSRSVAGAPPSLDGTPAPNH